MALQQLNDLIKRYSKEYEIQIATASVSHIPSIYSDTNDQWLFVVCRFMHQCHDNQDSVPQSIINTTNQVTAMYLIGSSTVAIKKPTTDILTHSEDIDQHSGNIVHITNLSNASLMKCCHYLDERDIFAFSEVNKHFNVIGMDPNTMKELTLRQTPFETYHDIMRKVNNNRYTNIAGIICTNMSEERRQRMLRRRGRNNLNSIEEKQHLSIPYPTAKYLKFLGLYQNVDADPTSFSTIIKHQFENLCDVSLANVDPKIIFDKIDEYDILKLRRINLHNFKLDTMFKSLINCRNIESLIVSGIKINQLTIHNFQQQLDATVAKFKREKYCSNLKKLSVDIPAMVSLKSFFYHLLSSSNKQLTLKFCCTNSNGMDFFFIDESEISKLFSLNDNQNEEEIQDILSKLKVLQLHLHTKHVNAMYSILLTIQNMSEWIEACKYNVFDELDMFKVRINTKDSNNVNQFRANQFPVNSVNVWDVFDLIVRNARNSRLELRDCNDTIIQPLLQRFYQLIHNNKPCFKEIYIEDNCNVINPNQHILRDQITRFEQCLLNGQDMDIELWGKESAELLWDACVQRWAQFAYSLNNSQVRKFYVAIRLMTVFDITDRYQNVQIPEWAHKAFSSITEHVEIKLAQYKNISYKFTNNNNLLILHMENY
eukprot:298672_1